ncbi:hydroxymethylbilane synthase [Altibacter sp. HG106]|uniref:hydroxymethylbilane synthase n=1 Tax=Altibacter sp. HG106 TaxID=3023937 RepID=UPI00235061FF|nr:hydroxymethylbilane synthase [Altibacter sp. HG106]MDC7995071.1 hydroxymethylbilane synthase [Altibacter sp. HG106]
MSKVLRVGTRDSALALWQATTVQQRLEAQGHTVELIPVKSTGDLNVEQPLYEMGITGIFTKTLDIALLQGTIDLAVHSMKDVPTQLPDNIREVAVLERASSIDILVTKGTMPYTDACTIATGSLRRKAQWLHRYPHHKVVGLRGNVNTRLQKLADSDWNGAIFAEAGLQRIDLLPKQYESLDWMLPAPAQGAMLVVSRAEDSESYRAGRVLNNESTELCTHIERAFLRRLEGGCTAPIGALATLENEQIQFKGVLFSLDGTSKIEVSRSASRKQLEGLGEACADEILQNGGRELMNYIKSQL